MKIKTFLKRGIAMLLAVAMLVGILPKYSTPVKAEAAERSSKRYNVLVLDNSDTAGFQESGITFYTAGTAIEYVKTAALKFINDIRKADGENYVALVTYNNYANVLSDFTTDYDSLVTKINGMQKYSDTRSIAAGLSEAKALIENVKDEPAQKNVILLTTGLTNTGDYSYEGFYDSSTIASGWHNISTGIHLYAYANSAIAMARAIDELGATVYSVGVFQTMADIPEKGRTVASFLRMTAEDLASNPMSFYPADDPAGLEFVFGEIAESLSKDRYVGNFKYQSGEKDYSAKYCFTTDYFEKNAEIYNPSLATMSLCFAMSAFGSYEYGGYAGQYMNAYNLLDALEFQKIETNDYFKQIPHEDTMGVIAGYREITINDESFILIAAATRGAGYESEWAGNITMGSFGRHEGFNKAATEVKRFLNSYVAGIPDEVLNGKTVKFWITGYSRGAATANLVAADITKDKKIGKISLLKSNIYAYCFEPPQGENWLSAGFNDEKAYNNIHNIVNPDDLVPRVAMSAWGFYRYGTDENVIPAVTTISDRKQYDKMMEIFRALDTEAVRESLVQDKYGNFLKDNNGKYIHVLTQFQAKHINPDINWPEVKGHWEKVYDGWGIFDWYGYVVEIDFSDAGIQILENSNRTMGDFQNSFLMDMCLGFTSRASFSELVEPTARAVLSIIFGGEAEKLDRALDYFVDKLYDNILSLCWSLVKGGTNEFATKVTIYLVESLVDAGIEPRGYLQSGIALTEALRGLISTLIAAIFTSGGDDIVTFAYNVKDLFKSHYPELILAWMMSNDPNYVSSPEHPATPVTRIVRINCPVDVEVYDKEGMMVAAIYDDMPLFIDESLIQVGFNADGEKQVWLPADGDYNLVIRATGDGTFNYSIDEYSYATNSYIKIVNYYDVPIATGDVLRADVPACNPDEEVDNTKGLDVEYTLFDKESEKIKNNEILTGEKADAANYYISVGVSNPNSGIVMGGGAHALGSFVTVSAFPFQGCEFLGWYDEKGLVSEEREYRFRVEGEVKLTAKFEGERYLPGDGAYEIQFDTTEGGKVIMGESGWYEPNSSVPVGAVAEEGYVFSHWKTSGSGHFENITSEETIFVSGKADTVVTAVFVKEKEYCPHSKITGGKQTDNTCTENGHISAIVCEDCGTVLQEKVTIKATGHHFVEGKCAYCGMKEKVKPSTDKKDEEEEVKEFPLMLVIGIAAGVVVLAAAIVVIVLVSKKKRGSGSSEKKKKQRKEKPVKEKDVKENVTDKTENAQKKKKKTKNYEI